MKYQMLKHLQSNKMRNLEIWDGVNTRVTHVTFVYLCSICSIPLLDHLDLKHLFQQHDSLHSKSNQQDVAKKPYRCGLVPWSHGLVCAEISIVDFISRPVPGIIVDIIYTSIYSHWRVLLAPLLFANDTVQTCMGIGVGCCISIVPGIVWTSCRKKTSVTKSNTPQAPWESCIYTSLY